MEAACNTCNSSPPRPNTNGSPPLRRTTRLPCCAYATNNSLVFSCITLWLPARLPTLMRSASLRMSCKMSSLTKASYNTTSASCKACKPLSVSKPASPGPAPTNTTSPAWLWWPCNWFSSSRSAACKSPCAVKVSKRLWNTCSQKRRLSAMLWMCCLTLLRQRPAMVAASCK